MKSIFKKMTGITTLCLPGPWCYDLVAKRTWSGLIVQAGGAGDQISPDMKPFGPPAQAGSETLTLFILITAAAIAALVLLNFYLRRKRKTYKCAFCAGRMKMSGVETTPITSSIQLLTTIYTCPNCGNVMTKTAKHSTSDKRKYTTRQTINVPAHSPSNHVRPRNY